MKHWAWACLAAGFLVIVIGGAAAYRAAQPARCLRQFNELRKQREPPPGTTELAQRIVSYGLIKKGMHREDVLGLLGRPDASWPSRETGEFLDEWWTVDLHGIRRPLGIVFDKDNRVTFIPHRREKVGRDGRRRMLWKMSPTDPLWPEGL